MDDDLLRQYAPSIPCACIDVGGPIIVADDGCVYHELEAAEAEIDRLRDGLAPLRDHPTAGGIIRALLDGEA